MIINDNTLSITVSIGLASLSQIRYQTNSSEKDSLYQATEGLDQLLLGKADEALYQAKETGRNQVIIKKMASQANLKLAWLAILNDSEGSCYLNSYY